MRPIALLLTTLLHLALASDVDHYRPPAFLNLCLEASTDNATLSNCTAAIDYYVNDPDMRHCVECAQYCRDSHVDRTNELLCWDCLYGKCEAQYQIETTSSDSDEDW